MMRKPQHLKSGMNWYYEYPTYLLLVHEVKHPDGRHIRTDNIKIPWRMIKQSLARSYKPRQRRRVPLGR